MCTVSIISHAGGYRLVTNRDEHRERAPALPPRWHGIAPARRALWPIDAVAGGTWIAAAESGLTLAILNLNAGADAPRGPGPSPSRGLVIPRLINSANAEEAAERLGSMDLSAFLPFRLVAADASDGRVRIVESRWDSTRLALARHAEPPICFVSSGLGDHLVEPRLDLFEQLVAAPGATPERQDAFHAHSWPDRPAVSVLMSRPDARTVSTCAAEVRPAGPAFAVRMTYRAIPDRAPAAAMLREADRLLDERWPDAPGGRSLTRLPATPPA